MLGDYTLYIDGEKITHGNVNFTEEEKRIIQKFLERNEKKNMKYIVDYSLTRRSDLSFADCVYVVEDLEAFAIEMITDYYCGDDKVLSLLENITKHINEEGLIKVLEEYDYIVFKTKEKAKEYWENTTVYGGEER